MRLEPIFPAAVYTAKRLEFGDFNTLGEEVGLDTDSIEIYAFDLISLDEVPAHYTMNFCSTGSRHSDTHVARPYESKFLERVHNRLNRTWDSLFCRTV
jgi:hypothetical protein